jgi:GTP-binding protein
LIDTAGVRRKGKVDEMIEKFSIVKTLQAMKDAHVVVVVLMHVKVWLSKIYI